MLVSNILMAQMREELMRSNGEDKECNISVVRDEDGNKIVVVNDVIFKGKKIVWEDVERYLKRYVGEFYKIADDSEIIFIGTELPGEYTGSVYTKRMHGAGEKAKANAAQIIPEMIQIAQNGTYESNRKEKHNRDAKNGWYRYDTRFAMPVYNDCGELERYNIFKARLLIRHSSSGKKVFV